MSDMNPADTSAAKARALALHGLHERKNQNGQPLVFPNAWDVLSARIVEAAGFPAIATSSASVAWSLGYPDGERCGRDEMLAVAARIVRAVKVPVTADLEAGYGDVDATVTAAIAVGVVGMNLEDATDSQEAPLLATDVAATRIRQARAAAERAGVRFFVNARTDVYLRAVGREEDRLAHALERARAYRAAGADGIFVPGVQDPKVIEALVRGIDAPVNVLARFGTPSVAELGRLGVARISLGSATASVAFAALRRSVEDIRDAGTFRTLEGALPYADANALFRR
jgi:2-methylisocitrate lyase-like PEP mutase family enzyme